MHTDRTHAQYMPISIGLLIEPSFLRLAVDDAMDRSGISDIDASRVSPAAPSWLRGWFERVTERFAS